MFDESLYDDLMSEGNPETPSETHHEEDQERTDLENLEGLVREIERRLADPKPLDLVSGGHGDLDSYISVLRTRLEDFEHRHPDMKDITKNARLRRLRDEVFPDLKAKVNAWNQ